MPLTNQQKPELANAKTNILIVSLIVALILGAVLGIASIAFQTYLAHKRIETEKQAQMELARAEEQNRQVRQHLRASGIEDSFNRRLRIKTEPILTNVSWTVPPRPVGASNNLIDLSASYNAPLDQGWIPPLTAARVATNNLRLLGHGIQVLGGVPFDIRGLIQLSGDVMKERNAPFPEVVSGIAVNLRGTKLHVLHAAVWDVPAGTIIGKYVVHYSDGQDEELFIRYDVDISGWTIAPGTATGAQQVWGEGQWKKSRRLFLNTYPLRQDELIQSIDFVARKTRAAPFVVAMTVE